MKIRQCLNQIAPYIPGKLKAGAIKLASNENPLGPSPRAMEVLRDCISRVYLYPDNACVELREALAAKHGLKPENIVAGNGSDEIMSLAAAAYINPGDNTVTAKETFSNYTFVTLLYDGTMRCAPLSNGVFDLPALSALVDERTRLVFLCNPNNPTGTYFGQDALEGFLKKVPAGTRVVSDEAYADFADARDFPDSVSLLAKYPNLLVMRTFSKLYGLAGLRVGYGIAREEVAADLMKAKISFSVNLPALAAARAALDDDEFVRQSLALNAEGRAYLYKEFDRLGLCYYPSQANFVCVDVRRDSKEMERRIMELGVTIRPLESFGIPHSLRVTVGTPRQNKTFIACLEKALSE
ncbi:MAG: histidinol-phosphate transaminase [Spirochaetales bacterium]|jgi:histidinol-phosphate aminotransferase|nr:histidinol-phosphate transaminase [Spirochaetales bacterium]